MRNRRETERERDPISERLLPSGSHGGQGPEGKPSSHLGGRQRKKKQTEEGGSLPLSPGGTGTPVGGTIAAAIYSNNSAIFLNTSITFPRLFTAVHSPATRYTPYLNMVLYASYYFPMTCYHPMMFE
jgi:hypothetical protein